MATAYQELVQILDESGQALPANQPGFRGDVDLVRRELDCAVVNYWINRCAKTGRGTYQTVRGAFAEGGPVYPYARILEKTHIQIAVRDLDCILGYFRPR